MGSSINRTILSAFYVFILEYNERLTELKIRSTEQGSIQPLLSNLFTGGLIFESLLKSLYPQKNNGQPVKTLGDIFRTNGFSNDFGITVTTSSISLRNVVDEIQRDDIESAFSTTSKLSLTPKLYHVN